MAEVLLTRFDAELTPDHAWRLPDDPGVTLRGALGNAFMHLACVEPKKDCRSCGHVKRCVVPSWFDPGRAGSHLTRPILPRLANEAGSAVTRASPLRLTGWLLGPIPRGSLFVEALVRMARVGLGPERVVHELTRLSVTGDGHEVELIRHEAGLAAFPSPGRLSDFARVPAEPTGALVHLGSPCVWSGVTHDRPPTATELMKAAIARVRKVASAQGVRPAKRWPDPNGLEGTWRAARWRRGERYSHRSSFNLDLSGWTGTLALGPEVAPFSDLLAAAQVLGVGKLTSAGRGSLVVEWT
ncbi:MAG: CRISPR system precrRNA processing endoribonuclease RAMP protein Cas6 [Alphaproteobacteria bacterium]|nr:CRISPR system precrRNA processing endoribonuclease RAMP protein Cas6 [Alphaproteobacteria bacterium]